MQMKQLAKTNIKLLKMLIVILEVLLTVHIYYYLYRKTTKNDYYSKSTINKLNIISIQTNNWFIRKELKITRLNKTI